MISFFRGIVISVIHAAQKIPLVTFQGRSDETISKRQSMKHYGLSSSPLPGAEVFAIRNGNNIIVIADHDRRYEISLEEGEVAVHNFTGSKIHFKKDGEIELTSQQSVKINAPSVSIGEIDLQKLIDERFIEFYNAHTHPDPVSGATGTPSPAITELTPCTTSVLEAA